MSADERWERDKVHQLLAEYHETGNEALREDLVSRFSNLVKYLASKFANRGEPLEDLQQVAYIGLLKAIERFDPRAGAQFSTYATPTIVGEIKRHFRDKGWLLKVPRKLQENKAAVARATEVLSTKLGRPPTVREIGALLKMTDEEVLEAQEVGQAYSMISLDYDMESEEKSKASKLTDYLGELDLHFDGVDNQLMLKRALNHLPRREQVVVYLRFFEHATQSQVARVLGISQMHVSRLQTRALLRLREVLARELEATGAMDLVAV